MRRRGFTLIELIVVVAIIIILAAILLPMITNRISDARLSRLASEYRTIKTAVAMYYADVGALPQNFEDLYNDSAPSGWRGPYIDKRPYGTGSGSYILSSFNTKMWLYYYSGTATWDSVNYSEIVYMRVSTKDANDNTTKITQGLAEQLDEKIDDGDLGNGILQADSTTNPTYLDFFLMGILD